MLNPENTLHKLLGMVLFRLPHNQRKWQACLRQYRPILEDTFKDNYAARLLVMKTLGQIKSRDIEGAQTTLQVIKRIAAGGDPAEKALWAFLHGLGYMQANNIDQAIRFFKSANRLHHRLYLPYLITADHYMNTHIDYPKAVSDFQTAIECIYGYPPLNEMTRRALCAAHADLCFCHVMMHQYDEAKADLLHAEQLESENEFTLHARIYLHAALRQAGEVADLLPRYKALCPEEFEHHKECVERILAEEDPHFSKLPIGNAEAIAGFWQTFLEKENDILQLLVLGDEHGAMTLIHDALERTDPDDLETITYSLRQTYSENLIYFGARFSHTNNALIDQLLAACPPQVQKRWHIIREP